MSVLLIYDGACRFCRFGMDVVRALDVRKAFDFCPFGESVAEGRLAVLPPGERHDVFHAVKDDVMFSGTAAARVTLGELPLGSLAVALGMHRFYPVLAKYRATLGRFVPDRPAVDTCSHKREPVPNR